MNKTEKLFTGIILASAVVMASVFVWGRAHNADTVNKYIYSDSNFGAFLAAQHAIYVNDFDSAQEFVTKIKDTDYTIVKNTRYLSEFLSGKIPTDAKLLKKEKSAPARLIYDAYLLESDDWKALYNRHKSEDSALSAPLRIWSAVATNHITDALKFIDKMPAATSWKSFIRGQIYAARGNIEKAAKEFADVHVDFMNINDYLYLMSFYRANNMTEDENILHSDFTLRPGGMYMLNYTDIPDWSVYSGYKNALAFSLIQNVSHTQIMMYSDLAILLLRFAQVTAPDFSGNNDAVNYYLGQFFYNNTGDYAECFGKIDKNSPFYPFAMLKIAEGHNNLSMMHQIVDDAPLFIPAVTELVSYYVQNGNKRAALRVVNNSLRNDDLTEYGRAFLLKCRAYIYYTFGDIDAAQTDIYDASVVIPVDTEIIALQAKIWAAQNREIENAYDYAMGLVQKNPSDVMAWDTLGRVVAVREGVDAALEILARIGDVSATNSALFEHLGDLYVQKGDENAARDAYLRAINLSKDGLTIVPKIKQKLRKLK